jgi:hypothetical protein
MKHKHTQPTDLYRYIKGLFTIYHVENETGSEGALSTPYFNEAFRPTSPGKTHSFKLSELGSNLGPIHPTNEAAGPPITLEHCSHPLRLSGGPVAK